MVKYLNCDCINSKCSAIVNQINLSGNMDFQAGLEFSTRFPMMYLDYLNRYKDKKINLFESYLWEEKNQKIINMVCYESYAFPTTLDTIEKSLKYFVKHYQEYNITEIAFPLLGCDDEGLRMVSVLPLMEKYLKPLPIDCYICFDIEGASNLELQMLEAYKSIDLNDLKTFAKLDDIQIASLIENRNNVLRFEDIYHIQGIDARTYRLIYEYYYNGIYKRLNPFHQESLFES
ncbi:MAG: hypothetical protein K2I42_02420 [Anaeroplasmataceae bacterium]|nr:hypothetical protein [Anaeroplasmataceae bacterium]